MFKIESYLTPYISAYFNKYVKDFNPQDFQVSMWQGGATFTNVNLNLEAVESELNLPVSLSSGHIHELKISIPWTKLTSESIVVNVKTIEITLKLKPPDTNVPVSSSVRRGTIAKIKPIQEVPPGYIQSIMNKIMNNVKVVCENVILKYVEEDIVFSLNVKTVVLSCVNSEWVPSFLELSTPKFMLRKLLTCSDLTVCLDKSNSSGKIETYQEPLLYKCSFDVRIMQQFHGYFAKSASFTRLDLFLKEMKFSITDEQIPMLLRLYNLIVSLSTSEPVDSNLYVVPESESADSSENECEEPDPNSMWSWGSWAVDLVSQIPEALLGPMDESTEPLGPCEFPIPVLHIGVFVDVATIIFKGIERSYDRASLGCPRIRYLPFLKCHLQGFIGDFITRGLDQNSRFGISKVVVEGMGICPCGLRDCTGEEPKHCPTLKPYEYLCLGKLNLDFSKNCLFDPEQCALGDERPPADYAFKYDRHVEVYTEEHMLDRTPGIALEILDIVPVRRCEEERHSDLEEEEKEITSETEKSLSRIVVGPCSVKVCSGSIHRAKILFFSAGRYEYEPYDDLSKLLSQYKTQLKGDALSLTKVDESFYKIQFTIIKPQIEILAADHPDYDSQSHIRAYYRRRRTTTTTPLSYIIPEWPRFVVTCDTVDGSCSQPNVRFSKLARAWTGAQFPPEIAKIFTEIYDIKVYNLGIELASNDFRSTLCCPFNLTISSTRRLEPCVSTPLDDINVLDIQWKIDDITVQFAKPHLMMAQIIVVSCVDEKMSEHLSYTSILQDLPNYRNGDIVVQLNGIVATQVATCEVGSYRLIIGEASMQVSSPNFKDSINIFHGPILTADSDEENKLGMIILQAPLNLESILEDSPPMTNSEEAQPPIFILKITAFKFCTDMRMFDWIDYSPKSLKPPMLARSARMSSHSLYPTAPLYTYQKTDSRRPLPGNSSDDGISQESIPRSPSYSGIYEMYRTPHASTHGKTTGTGTGTGTGSVHETGSQSIGTEHPHSTADTPPPVNRHASLEEEFMVFSPHSFAQSWERWIVKHLCIVKKTFVLIGVEESEWCILVREKKDLDPEEGIIGTFSLQCPMFVAHPQATVSGLTNAQYRLPVSLPSEMQNRELYPLRIQFSNICGFTDHPNLNRIPFLFPVQIQLTLTMADKNAEGKRPSIASCVHSDIPSVRFEFCYPQVKLLARMFEQTLHTTSFFLNTVPSLMLPPLDSYDIEVSPSRPAIGGASTTGSIGYLSLSQSQSQKPKHFNSSSSLLGSSEVPCSASLEKTSESHILEDNGLDQTTATFWVQMPLAQFQLVLTNSETGEKADTSNQLVFEVEDILSHLDVHSEYVKWSFKVSTMNLRSYQKDPAGTWNFGKCLGVIMSCGEELTRDIQVLQASGATQDENEFDSRTTSPIPAAGTSSVSPAQQHRVLSFTFTRVVAKDFHWKSEVSSPIARWNAVLQKYYEKSYVPYEEVEKRVLSEFDIKLKSLDFLLCPLLFSPFIPSFQELLNIKFPTNMFPPSVESPTGSSFEKKQARLPSMTNNNLPLLYFESEAFRVFFKTYEQDTKETNSPDVAIFTISSISMHSQSENPMHRTLLKPELYRLAEQARIIFIPGSPVEDRQYQIQFRGVSVVTCNWNDIEANSRRKFTNRSSALLKTMGENPAFEWNAIESGWNPVEVFAQPVLDRLDFSFAFSPAIVYERLPGSHSSDVVIGGYSFELNVTNNLYVNVNVQQLHAIVTVAKEFNQIYTLSAAKLHYSKSQLSTACIETDMQSDIASISVISPIREIDSGVGSLHNIASTGSSRSITYSGDFNRLTPTVNRSLVPLDMLITVSHVQLVLYRLLYNASLETEESDKQNRIIGMTPVFFVAIEQPHFVLVLGNAKQKMEVSIFDIFMSSGDGESKSVTNFTLPQKEDFIEILFESLEGERNPKTGMRTSFCTLTVTDFWHRPCNANCEFFHPVRVIFNQKRLSLSLYKDFVDLLSSNEEKDKIRKVRSGIFKSNSDDEHPVRVFLGYIYTARIAFNQLVLEVDESPPNLQRAAISFSVSSIEAQIQSQDKYGVITGKPVEHVHAGLVWNSAMVSTLIGDRTSKKDILVSPWNGKVVSNIRWYRWLKVPCSTVRISTDPISIYFGPQNILALLQLYHTFGEYLQKVLLVEEEQIVEILEALPRLPYRIETYKDNLKSGTFKCIPVNSEMDFPAIYQAAFCQQDQTMTWRYPEPRVIIQIEVHPIPIEIPESRKESARIRCAVEYWDDAVSRFCPFAIFHLQESASGFVQIPSKDRLHDFAALIWRIKIIMPLEEQIKNYERILKPELLYVCVKIDSEHNPGLIPKLKLSIEIPKLSIHMLNHLKYAGRIPEEDLHMYSIFYGGLTLCEQPFAVLELSHNSFLCQMWMQRVTIDWAANLKLNVTDYSYLTEINVVDPFRFESNWGLIENQSQEVFSEIDVITKPIVVKIGASALHTTVLSLVAWHQVLNGYGGEEVDFSSNHLQSHLTLTQILICNDTGTRLSFIQVDTTSPLFVQGRQCYAYTWYSQRAPSKLKVGIPIKDDEIAWGYPFYTNQCGKFVRKISNKTPLFIQISQLSATQKKIVISGAVSVANALDEAVEVGILQRFGGSEYNLVLEGRSYGPSHLMDLSTVEHIRFKFTDSETTDHHGWSDLVTFEQLRTSTNKSVILSIYEESDGSLVTYNVWCSLVEETMSEATRYLIVLSPFYRMRSSLSLPTKARMATARYENSTEFVLEGRGSELQLNFLGDPDVAHHLTFRTRTSHSSSKPSIPLLPAGPALENVLQSSPIDDILDEITGVPKPNSVTEFDRWPYVGDDVPVTEWVFCSQPETDLQVCFKPWITGLPSVMIDARPWALFVNMIGGTLLFTETEASGANEVTKLFEIPNMCAFSPSKIQEEFKFGIEIASGCVWTQNLEFTKEKSRTDIHYINSNWKVPIDCISRLEIHGNSETVHLTLEAKLRNSILVLTIRPTFCIQNRLRIPLTLKGFTLNRSKVVNEVDLDLEGCVTLLDPNDSATNSINNTGVPLISFSCDWDTETETDVNKSGMKYIGLRTNDGPFWFVQLMKFELIFNNMSANQGIHARRQSISLHTCQPTFVSGDIHESLEVTLPISLSWTCKNGQVWISIAEERRPQLLIHNLTNIPFIYAESDEVANGPYNELSPFPQYLYLPPYSKGHHAFPTTQSKFPNFTTSTPVPHFVLGKPSFSATSSSFRRLSMIFPEFETLEWSKGIKCENPERIQPIHIGRTDEISYVKVHTEQLGLTYYAFIEQMSNAEVSAKDIRGRICSQGGETLPLNAHSPSLTTILPPSDLQSESSMDISAGRDNELKPDSSDSRLGAQHSSRAFYIFDYYPVRLGRFCMSELLIILTDDLISASQKREIISFTAKDLFLNLHTETDKESLRILNHIPQEKFSLTFRVGDIQIDNALYEEKKYDFPVILLKEEKYKPRLTDDNFSLEYLDKIFDKICSDQNPFLIEFSCLFGLSSPTQTELLKIWLTLEPFTVNLEDQFVNFITPALDKFLSIVMEHASKLSFGKVGNRTSINLLTNVECTNRSSEGIVCTLKGVNKYFEYEESEFNYILIPSNERSIDTLSTPISSHFTSSSHVINEETDLLSYSRPETESDDTTEMSSREYSQGSKIGGSSFSIGPIYDNSFEDSTSVKEGLSSDSLIDKIMTNLKTTHSKRVQIPPDVRSMMKAYAEPIYLQTIIVTSVTVFVTMRMSNKLYIAVDHSPLHLAEFDSTNVLTTSFELGQAFGKHYLSGAIYKGGNPVRIIGSMELLGSPGPFVRSVTTGMKDFIVYPYEGLFKGPLGFLLGVSHGCGSLVKNVGAGTLTSLTNWAWSMSRNIDRLTLDPEEQIQHEEGRRAHIDGFTDGLYHGLTGFAIRLLGAVGGLTHHTMQSVIESGASPGGIVTGIGKGLIGVVTKPIGGAVELVAMTGQGLLRGAGWTPKFERQNELFLEDISSTPNALVKYRWRLWKDSSSYAKTSLLPKIETVLLVVDATESSFLSALTPVTLILTTESVIVMDTTGDNILKQISIMWLVMEQSEDKTLIRLKSAPPKNHDDVSLAKERVIDFVRSSAVSKPNPLLKVRRTEAEPSVSVKRSMEGFSTDNGSTAFGDFLVDPTSKSEFHTLLKLAQKEKTDQVFPVLQ